jgi:ubiquinol-cytochrome c reductase cytochrome b subunit
VLAIMGVIATFWLEGVRAPWSPAFTTQVISPQTLHITNPEVQRGLLLFHQKGCQYCHRIDGIGGQRGPDLSDVAGRLNTMQITIRIINGGVNMPAYARMLQPDDLNAIVAFLATRGRPVGSTEPPVTTTSAAVPSQSMP